MKSIFSGRLLSGFLLLFVLMMFSVSCNENSGTGRSGPDTDSASGSGRISDVKSNASSDGIGQEQIAGRAASKAVKVINERLSSLPQSIYIEGAENSKIIYTDFGGEDTYTILPYMTGDVEIRDNQASTVILPEELAITSARFMANGVQFTVNGHVLTLIGKPSSNTYVFAGTPLDASAGIRRTFAQTAQAFGATVPASGISDATITGTIQADGSLKPANGSDIIAPSVPAGLKAVYIYSSYIILGWNASTDNVGVKGYKVFSDGVLWTTVTSGLECKIPYFDPSSRHCFKVSAIDDAGNESAQSSEFCASTTAKTDMIPPSTPEGLKAVALSATSVRLSWNASTDNVGVTDYSFRTTDGSYAGSTVGTNREITITGLSPSTRYCFTVTAHDEAPNCSAPSAEVCITPGEATDSTPPTTPANLSTQSVTSSSVSLLWNASTDNIGVTGYKIYRDGILRETVTPVSGWTDTGLTASTNYCYTVAAIDAAGNQSSQSSQKCVVTSALEGTDVGVSGGSVEIQNLAKVTFPAGAFTANQLVKMEATQQEKTANEFNETASIFKPTAKLPYEIRINTSNVRPESDVTVSLKVPESFIATIPAGSMVEVFAQLWEEGGEEVLDSFQLVQSSFSSATKTIEATIFKEFFTNNRNDDKTYEVILMLAATPGVVDKTMKNSIRAVSDCGDIAFGSPMDRDLTITRNYNPAGETHPVSGFMKPHYGIDFRAETGTDLLAVADGIIDRVSNDSRPSVNANGENIIVGYGYNITLDISNSSGASSGTVRFGHLKEGSILVKPGDTVHKGQIIAKTNNSGGSTGPHLHMEYAPNGDISDNKSKANPYPCFPVITSLNPDSGKPGDTVELTGTGFSEVFSENSVTFTGESGLINATVISGFSTTRLMVTVPAGVKTGNVRVKTRVGESSAVVFTHFSLTSLKPSKGKAGDTVELTGTGFSGTLSENTVWFTGKYGAISVSPISGYSTTKLMVTVPNDAKTGNVWVQSKSKMSDSLEFTVVGKRYQDNGNGCVTDLKTGLVWKKVQPSIFCTWYKAMEFSGLPSKDQLLSLVPDSDEERQEMYDTFITYYSNGLFWSSTPYDENKAWGVYIAYGDGSSRYNKNEQENIWLLCSGE